MRVTSLIIVACALFVSMGCGQASSPTPTPTPTATTYGDPAALYRAIGQAGSGRVEGPRVEELKTGAFASNAMPASARAVKATFLVAVSEGTLTLSDRTPATAVVGAVFPDAAGEAAGRAYGDHMAGALGYPSIWQLEGPNWLVWSVERQALRLLQTAIGGVLSETAPPQT